MANSAYPAGVENHGGKLRITFKYRGKRVRENLRVPDTPKNRKIAGELRASVCFAIRTGTFDYAERFPDSPNLKLFGLVKKDITVGELAQKWLTLKAMEISSNALNRYQSVMKNMLPRLGPGRLASSITKEDLLFIRKDLLTGEKGSRKTSTSQKGRTVPTVNYYMTTTAGMFSFAAENGYLEKNPFNSITPLRKSKPVPDPLTRDEFSRLIDACHHQQTKNLWTVAVFTGMRHGEIAALAWEDIDLKAGTITVRRNFTKIGDFTLPKTDAGTNRVIHLLAPAIEALKKQAMLTRLSRQHQITVQLREYGRTILHECTFVFCPQIVRKNHKAGINYAVSSIGATWDSAIKRAGIRSRKAYQSRHTYACWALSAGANPTFIASQMGHSSASMVYNVYGAWMPECSVTQVAMLNNVLNARAPDVPQSDQEDEIKLYFSK
ncbi:TPA: tyrosine-type recombinase/integrase [Escherichia coli]